MNGSGPMFGGRDDHETAHIYIDDQIPDPKPDSEDRVNEMWVLVAIHEGGGEGIYGQTMPGPVGTTLMVQFIASSLKMKEMYDRLLREQGTVTVAIRDAKVQLEWRKMTQTGEVERLGA